ncbi:MULTISPECIES: LysR substrate-binding domain-containing protein [Methylotenera]|uniref:LysR substrate-binding domain-containing protein n=1 Tax=Methylotenera TaxID=359407 RepID=UPI000366259B|nr:MULTISPECIES: LysR substrate-binding domain-containing protein [Methylotenera]
MSIKLSLESLEVLDAIARKGSFAAAAESLFRVPSALTYTVRKLEEDLGVSLFNRSGHRAELTEAGAELLREGRNLLNAASELENRVKRIASGVETELTIAVSDLFNISAIYPLLNRFYAQNFGTRLRILREVYGGSWDALISGRADISLGAPGDGPSGGGYTTKRMGALEFHYAVAAHHPLAKLPEPLQNLDIMRYRAISGADSSRNLPPRTSGILTGQDVLTVPDIHSKLKAQIAGLGVGYLPKKLAEKHAATGELVIKLVAEPKPETAIFLAWCTKGGKAQQWLLKELQLLELDELLN